MKIIHLVTGVLVLIVFALTGQYMLRALELPSTEMSVQRMMYRASHIYLLWVGCLNVILGCYWQPFAGKLSRYLQYSASLLIVLAQPVLLMAFLSEPAAISATRELTKVACVFGLIGALFSVAAVVSNKFLGSAISPAKNMGSHSKI